MSMNDNKYLCDVALFMLAFARVVGTDLAYDSLTAIISSIH